MTSPSSAFKVKPVAWRDASGRTRASHIVLQNANGPCPLIALVNTLVLSAQDDDSPLATLLAGTGEVEAGALLGVLADVLLGSADAADAADVEAVLSLLPSLPSGLNINPRFDGTFEASPAQALFRAFGVDLVHGWVADPDDRYYHDALARAPSYEDAQGLLVQLEELTAKVADEHALTAAELATVEAARLVRQFLDLSATQLTPFGLAFLAELLSPGRFAVFFRNDHFSTIYRHPDSRQLFMLVTDAGYGAHKNVVWESLDDISGSSSLFFNGVFDPSEFGEPDVALDGAGVTAQAQAQATDDRDYELARELQMNEDRELALAEQRRIEAARAERERARRTDRRPPRASDTKRQTYVQHGQEARGLLNELGPSRPSRPSRPDRPDRPDEARRSKPAKEKDRCIVM